MVMKKVEAAVKEAELTTSGEIVPMIVRQSAVTGHVPVILFLILGAIFDIVYFQLPMDAISPVLATILGLILCVLGSFFFSKITFVKRLFISESDLDHQAQSRAELEFYRAGLQKTDGSTGLFFYF
jgi:putative membrane protein